MRIAKATIRKRVDRKPLPGRVVNVTVVDQCYQSEISATRAQPPPRPQEHQVTSLTMHRPWTTPTLRHALVDRHIMLNRQLHMWANVINAATAVLRPLLITTAVITAATATPAPAHADPNGDSITNALNQVGIGNNGPVSTAIAGIGQSICPMLVQPGATLASVASQMAGNTGLSPAVAGFVTTIAIQMGCPSFMTSLANGNLPFPLQLPGANPAQPNPFGLPRL